MVYRRRGELAGRSIEKITHLLRGAPDGGRRPYNLWITPILRKQDVECRLIRAGHRTERPGYQVQLILNNQIRRICPAHAEESVRLSAPYNLRKFINRADQERRMLMVDILVYSPDRKGSF